MIVLLVVSDMDGFSGIFKILRVGSLVFYEVMLESGLDCYEVKFRRIFLVYEGFCLWKELRCFKWSKLISFYDIRVSLVLFFIFSFLFLNVIFFICISFCYCMLFSFNRL